MAEGNVKVTSILSNSCIFFSRFNSSAINVICLHVMQFVFNCILSGRMELFVGEYLSRILVQ